MIISIAAGPYPNRSHNSSLAPVAIPLSPMNGMYPSVPLATIISGCDGDVIDDPSTPWPEERETVTLGRLEVTKGIDEPTDPPLINDPNNLCDGIEASEDKILAARSHAYSVSIDRRLTATPKSGA